ncbi:MucB/RseB C-terminal domain-containing protein [Litorivivens sp.]|uniref:MucB/RseB C-terminal domain-containing protein n=1 Tax=Litorivivens sp. TaxID=2020868 RepID=UPI00356A368E
MLRKTSAHAVWLLFLAGAAWADQPREWLERMSHGHREVSYQGIVSHQVEDRLTSYKVIHQVHDGREFELLQPLDTADKQLVRKGHSIHCVHPAERLLRGSEPTLSRHYDLTMGDNGWVAGREVVTVNVVPRDVFRLGYRLSLDLVTGVPLKTETLDQQDRVLERFQFMMFDTTEQGQLIDSQAREVSHREPASAADRALLLAKMPWKPGWIPDGFTLAEPGEGANDALSFTDGISTFSVFLEPVSQFDDSPLAAAMRSGATVSYTYPLPDADFVATVIGEVPLLTAEQVAKSLVISP